MPVTHGVTGSSPVRTAEERGTRVIAKPSFRYSSFFLHIPLTTPLHQRRNIACDVKLPHTDTDTHAHAHAHTDIDTYRHRHRTRYRRTPHRRHQTRFRRIPPQRHRTRFRRIPPRRHRRCRDMRNPTLTNQRGAKTSNHNPQHRRC